MEVRGLSFMSGKYTPADYLRLDLQLSSSQEDWIEAVNIFSDRICGRFFEPMRKLLNNTKNKLRKNSVPTEADLIPNGFAVTALACLLLETLMQFKEGIPATDTKAAGKRYKNFLTANLLRNYDVTEAKDFAKHFYEDIRCGILHSGETKNGSCLTIEQHPFITSRGDGADEGAIKVDVILLEKKLWSYFIRYCMDLAACTDITLRSNFKKKMDSITRKWAESPKFTTLWNAICAKKGKELRISSEETLTINDYNDIFIQFNDTNIVRKVDVCEAVCFWNDVESINAREGWEYIVPLFEACHEEADKFIIRAG